MAGLFGVGLDIGGNGHFADCGGGSGFAFLEFLVGGVSFQKPITWGGVNTSDSSLKKALSTAASWKCL